MNAVFSRISHPFGLNFPWMELHLMDHRNHGPPTSFSRSICGTSKLPPIAPTESFLLHPRHFQPRIFKPVYRPMNQIKRSIGPMPIASMLFRQASLSFALHLDICRPKFLSFTKGLPEAGYTAGVLFPILFSFAASLPQYQTTCILPLLHIGHWIPSDPGGFQKHRQLPASPARLRKQTVFLLSAFPILRHRIV